LLIPVWFERGFESNNCCSGVVDPYQVLCY
jgi:hypothetical protein